MRPRAQELLDDVRDATEHLDSGVEGFGLAQLLQGQAGRFNVNEEPLEGRAVLVADFRGKLMRVPRDDDLHLRPKYVEASHLAVDSPFLFVRLGKRGALTNVSSRVLYDTVDTNAELGPIRHRVTPPESVVGTYANVETGRARVTTLTAWNGQRYCALSSRASSWPPDDVVGQ